MNTEEFSQLRGGRNMTKTSIIHNHIKTLTMYYILNALADYILDPFSQLDGSDIDG